MLNRKPKFLHSAKQLVQHLNTKLDKESGYPDQPSWGYAFTYLLAKQSDSVDFNKLAEKALTHLEQQDHQHPNYSWEFVVFAIQKLKKQDKLNGDNPLDSYHEKGTRMFNWFLLRNINKIFCGKFSAFDECKLHIGLRLFQNKEGLILDEFKTRSLQYHAFCLFILAHIIEQQPKNKTVKKHFLAGVKYAMDYILEDGTSIYIGRGQEQIFGYGSLIYALEFCHAHIEALDENILNKLADKVISLQREDGSYPLVLRARQPEKSDVCFKSDHPDGWYGYNTLYDYQPFLGYCLFLSGTLK
ncbi:hypothetical protein F0259_14755 [Vibrio cyclitrophicus]|uniref:hypothetical protein n=1 Tax=Vibrio cyclitrophicus TaxID=47951 RepID=UPI00148E47BC|nr:hypothetical protein [Vibrio cyclitrophicus]NOH45057.1 hypothetical protein [Vibrio cyclitrophicus]